MKAQFEKITYDESSSWQLLIRELDEIPFEWHFHPEYELTLTLNSQGERYIGTRIEPYSNWDLTLLGPNIPHTWHSNAKLDSDRPHKVYVLWFDHSWITKLTDLFPEFQGIQQVIEMADKGIQFSQLLAKSLSSLFSELDSASPTKRLTLFLQILGSLMKSQDCECLNISHSDLKVHSEKRQQTLLNKVLELIHEEYVLEVSVKQIARYVGMSESTLNRFFQRLMGQTFNQYIIDVRLAKACSLLIRSDLSVAIVANQSGFQNLSNFNRLFKRHKRMTPKEFRRLYLTNVKKRAPN